MVLFQKYRISIAVIVTIMAGYLFLPSISGLDLPLLPELNKRSIPTLTALLFAFFAINRFNKNEMLSQWFPKGVWPRLFLTGIVGGAFFTVLNNSEPAFPVPGLRIYDAFSVILNLMIMLGPFLLAYRFLASPDQHKLLLVAFCIAGLVYSVLALYEIRFSPQLNRMVYGFFPHDWRQHVRPGGFRPLVFLDHGLRLAIFFAMTILAALCAAKLYPQRRTQFLLAGGWLFLTLALSNSLGALGIALLLASVVIFLPLRTQLIVAAVIGLVVLTFPIARERGIISGDGIVSLAQMISAERAGSLQFRLDNEDILLARANEKPLFGWGGWGRSRVYDEDGQDISTTDGYWVIIFGLGGWTRYLSEFGLMVLPLGLLFYRRKEYDVGPETATIALILSANLIDLIPNSSMTPITWLVVGSLWGRIDWQKSQTEDDPQAEEDSTSTLSSRTITPYTRQKTKIIRR